MSVLTQNSIWDDFIPNFLIPDDVNTYLLVTEFEVRTVSYGPSFFPFDLWPKREARGS